MDTSDNDRVKLEDARFDKEVLYLPQLKVEEPVAGEEAVTGLEKPVPVDSSNLCRELDLHLHSAAAATGPVQPSRRCLHCNNSANAINSIN